MVIHDRAEIGIGGVGMRKNKFAVIGNREVPDDAVGAGRLEQRNGGF